ncbi:MAG TPA: glycosyl hydrolase [Acidobacteriaceae bacterium]|nr:glycosyl hydrolase [Acidobacteriaceae bacterium]
MLSTLRSKTCIALLLGSAILAQGQTALTHLEKTFQSPPDNARPMLRWWWFGPAVIKPELLREMQQMKAGGFGGFVIHYVYPLALDDPQSGLRNLPFLSPKFLDDVSYTNRQAHLLDLRAGLSLGSGWPYGGPNTPVTQAAADIRQAQTAIQPGETSVPIPPLEHGEALIAAFLGQSSQAFLGPSSQMDLPPSAQTILPLPAADATRLNLPAHFPATNNTVYWYIQSRTGQQVKRAALDANGFVLDHFSQQAVHNHLRKVADKLIAAFGNQPPDSVFSDSLEAFGSDWTPNFPQAFHRLRGYSILPYLPDLFTPAPDAKARAVRHDWGVTLTQLIDTNYLTQINNWANAHHTLFRSQTYGIPAVSMSSNNFVDLPEGEGPQWRQFSFTRWATSAGHIYGRPVISTETFTWLHSPAFRATPLDMEEEANRFFLEGSNQIYCHGWPYSPPSAGEPGWRFYASAVFNAHNPWWIVMPGVTRYLQRISWILRQGQPANRVAIYLPEDDAWAAFKPGHASLTSIMSRWITPALTQQVENAGYNFDYIDAAAIKARGIHYPVLVLPNVDRMSPATLSRIARYSRAGGKVIAVGRIPAHAPGFLQYNQISAQVSLASQAFFQHPGANVRFIPSVSQLAPALHHMVPPGMQLTPAAPLVGFIRRKLPGTDVYFIANTGNVPVDTAARFRSKYQSGVWLNPYNGKATVAISTNGAWPLHLPPYGSAILLLHNGPSPNAAPPLPPLGQMHEQQLVNLSTGWQVNFPGLHLQHNMQTLASWTNNPRTLYYSGVAVYHRSFTITGGNLHHDRLLLSFGHGKPIPNPAHHPHPGTRAWFDPPIHVAAIVYINGRRAGALWHPPYQLDVTGLLKPGVNQIDVHVANTAMNEMAGKSLPSYRLLWMRYGQRFVPQDMKLVHPLPSGLLGHIALLRRNQP